MEHVANHLDLVNKNQDEEKRQKQAEAARKARRSFMKLVTPSGNVKVVSKPPPKPPPKLQSSSVQLSKVLGEGAFGKVHLGLRKDTGAFVAVKQMVFQNPHPAEIKKVANEIKLMKRLNHRNIVRYLAAERKAAEGGGAELLIFMEYVPGGSLASVCTTFATPSDMAVRSPLSVCSSVGLGEETVQAYTLQMLEGLVYLHKEGVVHRDIKGENALVAADGCVKLADFGTASALDDCTSETVGTPWFMAPEVVRAPDDGTGHDVKADVWSLGATVVQLLTGQPPLYDRYHEPFGIMYAVSKGSVDFKSDAIPDWVSEECRDFVSQCFEREKVLRPSSEELLKHPWMVAAAGKLSDSEAEQGTEFHPRAPSAPQTGRPSLSSSTNTLPLESPLSRYKVKLEQALKLGILTEAEMEAKMKVAAGLHSRIQSSQE